MSNVPVHDHQPRGEWIKFLILTLIMLGTIVVIALLRPYIFGHVVPAVMGEGIVEEETAVEEETDTVTPVSDPTDASESESESDGDAPATNEEEESVDVEEGEDGEEETAVEPADPIEHVVLSGQTLNSIARRYDVTTQAIIDANNLQNPNVLFVGQTLTIPQAQN